MRSTSLLLALPVTLLSGCFHFSNCGDGIRNTSTTEECDDGNAAEGDGCDSNCTASACGNGVQAPNEECDDGNNANGDGCSAECTVGIDRCGNGTVDPNEFCDDGNQNNTDACLNSCLGARCGDGFIQVGVEQCDDGNISIGDGCDASCIDEGVECGNSVVEPGEQCDDSNQINNDACTGVCQNARCGDGFVFAGVEECDDGNAFNGDSCDNNCTVTVCGNGVVTPPEACDDGNLVGGDGCSASCTNESLTCGNDFQDGNEACDGSDLGAQSCQTLGFTSGNLACEDDCSDFDTSDCTGANSATCASPLLAAVGSSLQGNTTGAQTNLTGNGCPNGQLGAEVVFILPSKDMQLDYLSLLDRYHVVDEDTLSSQKNRVDKALEIIDEASQTSAR